jgi:hypothetical protein
LQGKRKAPRFDKLTGIRRIHSPSTPIVKVSFFRIFLLRIRILNSIVPTEILTDYEIYECFLVLAEIFIEVVLIGYCEQKHYTVAVGNRKKLAGY